MGNRPDEFAHVGNVILDQQRSERPQDDLLGQILGVLLAFAPLQSKAEYGFQVFSYNPLCILSVHLLVPRLKAFTLIDTGKSKGWVFLRKLQKKHHRP
jgi:hypothetical protein